MSKLLSSQKIDELDEDRQYYVDISSLVGFIKSNDSQLLNFEQLFCGFGNNITFICDKAYEIDIKYIFRYVFDDFSDVEAERDETHIESREKSNVKPNTVKKITDLDDQELEGFFENFNARLYGHELFKKEFKGMINSFRVFNKLGEHKILSLFLMGDSGVGKTEVARSIHKALGSKSKLAKINFGNYSSHDALNSLIGSPLGYIGSDGGELLKRVHESDVGLILIDEFEKANNAVFNYFLDVLENDLRQSHILAQIGRLIEHFRQPCHKTIVNHTVFYLPDRLLPATGLAADCKTFLQLVAGFSHHRTVHGHNMILQEFRWGIQCG